MPGSVSVSPMLSLALLLSIAEKNPAPNYELGASFSSFYHLACSRASPLLPFVLLLSLHLPPLRLRLFLPPLFSSSSCSSLIFVFFFAGYFARVLDPILGSSSLSRAAALAARSSWFVGGR